MLSSSILTFQRHDYNRHHITMPIAKLPDSTTRNLGSTLLLVTPQAVVKELVDNALDAKASSIDIIIASNTIDKIQVRDNGHGIDATDFQNLGRQSCTSKLQLYDDLGSVRTLGFRGIALCCANDASRVTITTRTEGSPMAAKLSLNPGVGGVQSQKPASAPVGTTVDLAGLHHKIPLRRKSHLKNAKKSINSMQAQLRAYALARPTVKMTLKILDSGKLWSFAPTTDGGTKEALLQVFGAELVSQCV